MGSDEMYRHWVVDWVLPTCTEADLRRALHALNEAGRRMACRGEPVRCVRSTYIPAQRRWYSIFTAASAAAVRTAHEIAQIPVGRIDEAIDLAIEPVPSG